MNPARRVYRELNYGSHPNVSTCNTAGDGAKVVSAPDEKSIAEAGSKGSRESCGKSFTTVCATAAGVVPPVPERLVCDCG